MDTQDDIPTPEKYLGLYFKEVTDSQQECDELEDEEHALLDEAEQATDFLQRAGLADLSKVYQQGKEIPDNLVNDSVRQRYLTEKQAQTVRSRVRTLNKTLKSRQPRRKQRQDVRNVAWIRDTSTGSRSRSATPDSLDSVNGLNEDTSASDEDQQLSLPPFESIDSSRLNRKQKWTSNSEPTTKAFKSYEKGDVAHLGSENVILKGYHQLKEQQGTLTTRRAAVPPAPLSRERSDSDSDQNARDKVTNDTNETFISSTNFHSIISTEPTENELSLAVRDTCINNEALSFEGLVRQQHDDDSTELLCSELHKENRMSIDSLSDSDYLYLKPILLVEVTAIFDQHKISFHKRKASNKRKRGNVFGVNLSTLVMRDMPTPADNSMVPQVYQLVLNQLNSRCLREDGILRVAGQKQKLELLCTDIEGKFYGQRTHVEHILSEATAHDLTGVLKKLLRDLPDPIFTMELFDMFFKSSAIPNKEDKLHALNLLVLMLPIEHRNTFRMLLNFLTNIVQNEDGNRMSLHNVAMITAPSFFPPRLLSPKENLIRKNSPLGQHTTNLAGLTSSESAPHIPSSAVSVSVASRELLQQQISDAAVCCAVMDLILRAGDALWLIPGELVRQAQDAQRRAQDRRELARDRHDKSRTKKKLQRSSTQYQPGAMLNPRITRDFMI